MKISNHGGMAHLARSVCPNQLSLLCFVLMSLISVPLQMSFGDTRVSDKIYAPLQSNHYCSRRLNATHQVGCTSELGGNVGVVWQVNKLSDLQHILKTGPTPPYTVVLTREHYSRSNLIEFKVNPNRVAGVILIEKAPEGPQTLSSPFSPEDTCPNRYWGLYANDSHFGNCRQNRWQHESPISGLLYDDIPYPIFYMNEKKSIDDIEQCFSQHNIESDGTQASYPLCSIHLDSFMLAASNTSSCLNSQTLVDAVLQSSGQRCGTIDNHNIFGYFKPTKGLPIPLENTSALVPEIVPPQSVVLIMAKLSSLSMFAEISPGAESTVSPLVTLLAVAEALSRARNNTEVQNSERNIAFALLDSEPFDYTGSIRMVQSMQFNTYPTRPFRNDTQRAEQAEDEKFAIKNLNLSSIDYILNLDQIAFHSSSNKLYLHADPNNKDGDKFAKAFKIMESFANDEIGLSKASEQLPLPPSPVHEFIKQSSNFTSNQRLLGLVISNYEQTYTNDFYYSIYDNSQNIYQAAGGKDRLVAHLKKVGDLIARSAYKLAFGGDPSKEVAVNPSTVESLLDCYLTEAECGLFTQAWEAGQKLPSGPIQTYKDPTKRSDDMNGAITSNLLAYFIGERLSNHNLTRCYEMNARSRMYEYHYLNGQSEPVKDESSGLCIRSQVLRTSALSPAYEADEYGFWQINPKYPAWTVSFSSIRYPARLFLKSNPVYQGSLFVLGVVITITSFIIVHQFNMAAKRVQAERPSRAATST